MSHLCHIDPTFPGRQSGGSSLFFCWTSRQAGWFVWRKTFGPSGNSYLLLIWGAFASSEAGFGGSRKLIGTRPGFTEAGSSAVDLHFYILSWNSVWNPLIQVEPQHHLCLKFLNNGNILHLFAFLLPPGDKSLSRCSSNLTRLQSWRPLIFKVDLSPLSVRVGGAVRPPAAVGHHLALPRLRHQLAVRRP